MSPVIESVALTIIYKILQREGGIADVGDGKGITRFGQTDGWLAHYGLTQPKTPEHAARNYRVFLHKTRLDRLCTVDHPLADTVIDYAIHSGTSVAIDALQRSLGTKADAVIGPKTEALLEACNRSVIALLVLAEREELIGYLISHKTSNARYAGGWMHRIAEQQREICLTLQRT